MSDVNMTEIGGDHPVFMGDFARKCCPSAEILHALAPDNLLSMEQFEAHRSTVVDLACKETNAAYYSGDHRERQSVETKFGDFVDYFRAAFRGERHWLGSVEGLQFYLCQCPIAVYKPDDTCDKPVLPRVMELFVIPQELTSRMELGQVNLWMAVQPSRTGIHYDAYRNVLVVLQGKKTVKLYPPSQTKYLYPQPIYCQSANHSSVNFAKPDLQLHPEFAHAEPIVMTASAGDAIYIPEGWWHQVDSDAFTIAINLWFAGAGGRERSESAISSEMGVYCARLVIQELVKQETRRTLDELQSKNRARHGERYTMIGSIVDGLQDAKSNEEREEILLAMSDQELKQQLLALAAVDHGVVVLKQILTQSSDAFAAFLADFLDRHGDATNWVSVIFEALGEEDADKMRNELLNRQERFKQQIYQQVVAATFGC